MGLRIIVGVPGSGKSARIIEIVEERRKRQQPVYLFLCRDGGVLEKSASIATHGLVSSRNGQRTAIDHFETTATTLDILRPFLEDREPATLVFEEAQYFLADIAPVWVRLHERGHDVWVSTPTEQQRQFLQKSGGEVTTLVARCNLFADGDATQFFILPETNTTLSVCDSCAKLLRDKAVETISLMLIKNEPHRGEKRVYQPIEIDLPQFRELVPIRDDSQVRAGIMEEFVKKHMPSFERRSKTYIDIGCNTGFFCQRMAGLGFTARGVDVVRDDILTGKLLDTYFFRRYPDLITADAVEFLLNDDSEYDVTSSFSVFQWLYLQSDKEKVDRALSLLFEKARSLVFFEMGYKKEAHYAERLAEVIDRDWMFERMRGSGLFSDIVLYEEGTNGLKRDFFVGIRKQ
ncbi:hypothetical protein [Reyranella sp.]|uniref:hypothetical protein n=1 Tax=Reyranella sp. TaxID=1929291 RepID=UPI003BACB385